jgi:16S rRNA (guanine(966)-N(2))-methyltransferase RsmD
MRIIGGKEGGRHLKVPKGLGVRPTPDLVKQALFNSLGERIIGAKVLELFGGSAALSLESLSRGAVLAVCVEKSSKHGRMIRQNADALGTGRQFELRIQDAFAAISQMAMAGTKFDLIMADPPYGEKNVGRRSTSFAQQLLDNEFLPRILEAGGFFILGHSKRDTLDLGPRWKETKMLKHGDSLIRFLSYAQHAE